jgi:tetratricopeptide (TPR) repeat protein
MALDRHKSLEAAERYLKQGKVQAALAELERLAAASPHDPITLNRMGDLLARQGRRAEAVGYYFRIAQQFAKQGFYPKAVAIYKKILRVEPDNAGSLTELGDLYVRQKLPGEARRYLLRAAELHLQNKDFATARSVYERLVAAEPDDPRHRARLAEARAAEGETDKAGEELVLLARSLLDGGKIDDADKTFRRAAELLPGRSEPTLGIAACMGAAGRDGDVVGFLEERLSTEATPELVGELMARYERSGRSDDAMTLMRRDDGPEIPVASYHEILRGHLERQTADEWWERVTSVFDGWAQKGRIERLDELLRALADAESGGHIPALRLLHRLAVEGGDRERIAVCLERLIRAQQGRSPDEGIAALLDELRKIAPRSPLLTASSAATGGTAPEAVPAQAAVPVSPPAAEERPDAAPPAEDLPVAASVPVQAEAPAVPLNKADEEFVNGRLTQADILEKYGLQEQALEQLREVVDRFPGHVASQQRLVALLRTRPERSRLGEALVGLALARRAAGDADAAREAAAEAMRVGSLDEATIGLLRQLELTPAPAPHPVAPTPPSAPAATAAPGEDVVLIDFDQMEEAAEPASPTSVQVRPPGEDMLEEIRARMAQGDVQGARQSVATLRAIGYGGEALDALGQEIDRGAQAPGPFAEPARAEETTTVPEKPAAAAPGAESTEAVLAEESFGELDEDDDLSAVTAALESELFAEEADSVSEEGESEQSLEDVFAAFKEHVEAEIGEDDFRTHYDLGIGYKEMGLLDEAIREFELAMKSPDLLREACAMLAICHREKQELDRAIGWYRRAIEAPGGDERATSGLRYELAELLLQSGQREAALGLFRAVVNTDPSYRDVQSRIAELEGSLS